MRCLFATLPAELRNQIYKECLVPGVEAFESCSQHLPLGVSPKLTTQVLAVSKQCYNEAKGMIYENVFVVNFHPGHSVRAVIHAGQIPDHVLPKIKHLDFVVDCTRLVCLQGDWRPLHRLTSLQTLNITGIENTDSLIPAELWTPLLQRILARIPKDCKIEFGVKTSLGEHNVEFMKEILKDLNGDTEIRYYRPRLVTMTEQAWNSKLVVAMKGIPEDFVRGELTGREKDSFTVGKFATKIHLWALH